jgi:four helix bundle protein
MFLQLAHTKLDAYQTSRKLVHSCYHLSKSLPSEERFNMVQQLRRAALSVHLNLAEGCSRKSEVERKRYFEISRGSIVEIDAIFDIASELEYASKEQLSNSGELLLKTFQIISKMISSTSN